jgi:hypothetical protein
MTTTIDEALNDVSINDTRGSDRVSAVEKRAVVRPADPRRIPPFVVFRSYDWMDHHALFSNVDC